MFGFVKQRFSSLSGMTVITFLGFPLNNLIRLNRKLSELHDREIETGGLNLIIAVI
jgi:hypothetical protein